MLTLMRWAEIQWGRPRMMMISVNRSRMLGPYLMIQLKRQKVCSLFNMVRLGMVRIQEACKEAHRALLVLFWHQPLASLS
jgi:hypothetical protein